MRGGVARLLFVHLLDFEFDRAQSGEKVVSVTVAEKHRQVNGVVHGSVIHALLDTVMGMEGFRAAHDTPVATAEMNVRFLEPVFDGRLEARARVLKAGKRLVVLEGEVRREGVLVAVAQATFAVIAGPRRA